MGRRHRAEFGKTRCNVMGLYTASVSWDRPPRIGRRKKPASSARGCPDWSSHPKFLRVFNFEMIGDNGRSGLKSPSRVWTRPDKNGSIVSTSHVLHQGESRGAIRWDVILAVPLSWEYLVHILRTVQTSELILGFDYRKHSRTLFFLTYLAYLFRA